MAKKPASKKNKINSKISADDVIAKYNKPREPRAKVSTSKGDVKSNRADPLIPGLIVVALLLGAVSMGLFSDQSVTNTNVEQNVDNSGQGEVRNRDFPLYDQNIDLSGLEITVYRTATCGCCHEFEFYMRDLGATIVDMIEDQSELDARKASLGMGEELYACHTAIVNGYFVEGHIPGFAIKKLVNEKPSIDGITSPGMAAGVAGMGGDKLGEEIIYAVVSGSASSWLKY